jgi:hypothetical protein
MFRFTCAALNVGMVGGLAGHAVEPVWQVDPENPESQTQTPLTQSPRSLHSETRPTPLH